MPRRKKGRRYGRRKGAVKSDRAYPAGATGGLLLLGVKLMTERKTLASPLSQLTAKQPTGDKVKYFMQSLEDNATELDNYKIPLVMTGASAAPKLPVLKLAAKPIDKAIRRATRGKVSL